jgi:trehalose 6-phosphate phosphatase
VLDTDATISALTERPERTALFVDFDGSLAAIVPRPQDARPLPGAVAALEQLTGKLGRVGVISGRPLAFLAAHLPVPLLALVGLYGMERRIDGIRVVDARVEPYLDAVASAVAELEPRLPSEVVEPKSGISVTLHWRQVPERADEIASLGRAVAEQYGLGVYASRMAVELRPPVEIDKGAVVRELVSGFAVGAFAGDDTGDLPAFAALADAARVGSIDCAVRVGVLSPEAPDGLTAAVDHMVAGPEALVALLARVADEIA